MPEPRVLIAEHIKQYRELAAASIGEAADMNSDTWEDLEQQAQAALRGAKALAERFFPETSFEEFLRPAA